MNTCHLCQKEFKYPYLLLRHLNRKFTCYDSNIGALTSQRVQQKQQNGYDFGQNGYTVQQNGYAVQQNGYAVQQNGYAVQQNGYVEQQNGNNELTCSKCGKCFPRKRNLRRHVGICRGNLLQCSRCGKMLSSRKTRAAHERNVKCV